MPTQLLRQSSLLSFIDVDTIKKASLNVSSPAQSDTTRTNAHAAKTAAAGVTAAKNHARAQWGLRRVGERNRRR